MNKITVVTRFNTERIEQHLELDGENDMFPSLRKEIMELKEEGVREALIKLGWTPPNE